MKMDIVAGSQNDEFYTPNYAVKPLLKYISPTKQIWCPFDLLESLIVKGLITNGNSVKETHLSRGEDFFYLNEPCDVIVSNPPYSMKNEVFGRLFALGKPFAMLVGVVGLFESKKRFEMFRDNAFEIMWMSKRIAYFKSYSEQKPSLNPPFSSVWVCKNILPKANVFEVVEK